MTTPKPASQANDYCDVCGCALHPGEEDLCGICEMNEEVQMEMDRDRE